MELMNTKNIKSFCGLIYKAATMVKKKKKVNKKKSVGNHWFKTLSHTHDWGFVPVNFNGWVALVLLIVLNVFAGNYFNLRYEGIDSWFKFGVVFLLSIFVFIEISKKKTKVVKSKKKK